MKERLQQELARRADPNLPFTDERVVSGAIRQIMEGMRGIRNRGGRIIYSEFLSPKEKTKVMRLLEKGNGGLVRRIEAIAPIRLAEGVGTQFLIREKGRR